MKAIPWRQTYEIHTLIDGDQYFPALLKACNNARHSIHISIYWFESGKIANLFIDALVAASIRGVYVTCLLDEIGSIALDSVDRQRLQSAGILLGWYNPIRFERLPFILQRDHSKLIIIDNQRLFIGGTGIADVFAPQSMFKATVTQSEDTAIVPNNTLYPATALARTHWRENMFELRGAITIDALASLKKKWHDADVILYPNCSEHQSLDNGDLTLLTPSLFDYIAGDESHRINHISLTANQPIYSRWIESRGQEQRQILKAVIKEIQISHTRIFLVTAYFAPDPRLRYVLKKAVKRGVAVSILIPGARTDHPLLQKAGQYYYQKLLKAGVHIYEYEPCFMHSKMLVCDNIVYLGSSNLDLYSQRWSLETNISVSNSNFANSIVTIIEKDLEKSRKITLAYWEKRPWWVRLSSFFAYKIGCWGDFLARQLFLMRRFKNR